MKYAITSHTKNKIFVEVTKNFKRRSVALTSRYPVTFSDTVTKSMEDLSRNDLITYAPITESKERHKSETSETTNESPRRGRRKKSDA